MEVREILEKLVSFNTIKDLENNKILDYIQNLLDNMGFQLEKREKVLIMYNKDKVGLGFLGHTDTVDYSEGWKYNPFCLTEEEGKLYGLGVCDMKSGIAAMISAISKIDFSKLSKGVKVYFTYDEEIGFSGIKDIVQFEGNFPKRIIIGEPTNNEVMVGSKGLLEYKINFKGIKTHSSTPAKGKNAIMSAVNFINELNSFYKNEIQKTVNFDFEIPYTTMNIGVIQGGSAINSVPDDCKFLVDFRTIDKNSEEKIVQKLQELKEKYEAEVIEINKISAFLNKTDKYNKTCNFITEASFLEGERFILGTGPVTAHEVNENITIESLNLLVEQYQKLILESCK